MAWELQSFNVLRLSEPAAAGPTVIACETVPVNYVWRVEAVTCWAPGGAWEVLLFDTPPGPNAVPVEFGLTTPIGSITSDQDPTEPLIGTYVAICDRNSPITIQGGDALSIYFIAVGVGNVGGPPVQARIQYQLLKGTGAPSQPILGSPAPAIPVGI